MNAICVLDKNSSFNPAKIEGTIRLHQCSPEHKTLIIFDLKNVRPPGKPRGCHIHRLGDLTKGCASLCEHYSPDPSQLHGSTKLPGGRHVGDLVNNIVPDEKGNVSFAYEDELVELFPPFSVIGRSVVIHEKEDDLGAFKGQTDSQGRLTEKAKLSRTTGDAGARVACAIIGLTDESFHPKCLAS